MTLDSAGRLVIGAHSGWDSGGVRMHARTSCELSLQVPAVVAPDDEQLTASTYREVSGRAPTVAGIAVTTTISFLSGVGAGGMLPAFGPWGPEAEDSRRDRCGGWGP